uniref:Protein kinase domain-containing protein n=1 Tax=Oryzias latipes TaxID=8090 RepID=A0A3B3HF33_ORYLA
MHQDGEAGSEEMEAMKIIRSLNPDQNNLIKIHECFQYKDYMCLVYEMLDESLEDFIGKRSFHPAHLCQIRAIAQQMLVALSGLESINVLHGDIKPDNIMFVDQITNPLKLKLIDFGLAVNPQELNVGTQMQINPFRAPEVILGLPLDVSVDMWSLAVVLHFGFPTVIVSNWLVTDEFPSLNRHLIVVEGFACPDDPGSCVARSICPVGLFHVKLLLGDGPDKGQNWRRDS